MESSTASSNYYRSDFIHPRVYPELPPGYTWQVQIKKYCPRDLFFRLAYGARRVSVQSQLGFVFCHRGLYDRAMKIPENSRLAIRNGVRQDLVLHEIDVRIPRGPGDAILAHDEVASRVTSNSHRWDSINTTEFNETRLVTRRVDLLKGDFASSYQDTEETVPRLGDVFDISEEGLDRDNGISLQLDLRGHDLVRAILAHRRLVLDINKLLFKGYNLDFPSGQHLEAALSTELAILDLELPLLKAYHSLDPASYQEFKAAALARAKAESEARPYAWINRFIAPPNTIMVFFSKPLIDVALREKDIDPDTASVGSRLRVGFSCLYLSFQRQIMSFIELPGLNIIPEIVHTGLGLGYDKVTGGATNPMNGTIITDPEVIFESRVDRVMIEISLGLRGRYPKMYFSSCTRLCEVRQSTGEEWVAGIKTGKLRLKPSGEKGISTKLRTIHGGLYPQSDLVVADDPFAEIAARTWIDEYAKLDRKQLLSLPYPMWLAQAGTTVETAVNNLNGPFLPNTLDVL